MTIVIAPILALRDREAPELARPEHDGGIEQPARLEILHQRGAGLIRLRAKSLQTLRVLVVRIPRLAAEEELHETHTALDEPPRQQTTSAVFLRLRLVEAVEASQRLCWRLYG